MEIKPVLRCFQSACRQRALMLPACNRPFDQPGPLENLHVLADRGLANFEWGCELANRCRALYQSGQDAPARAVGKSEEDVVKLLTGLHEIINS